MELKTRLTATPPSVNTNAAESLLSEVSVAIDVFFARFPDLLFNERELQLRLAEYLKDQLDGRAKIHLEYYVPTIKIFGSHLLNAGERMYVDIVVERDGVYVPIELKYKTKALSEETLERFGNHVPKAKVLQNHGAYPDNIARCCEDLYRLYRLWDIYHPVIPGGIFVFLTNDPYYRCHFTSSRVYSAPVLQGHNINHNAIGQIIWIDTAMSYNNSIYKFYYTKTSIH